MTHTCERPIPWETLVDYFAGELSPDDASSVEEQLFGCSACTDEAGRVASVTETLRAFLPPVVSRERVEGLRARGVRIHENAFSPGDRRDVVFERDTDFLIHRLAGLDLTDAERVSFRIHSESTGEPISEADEVPFEREEGAILIACQRHYRAAPPDTVFNVSIHPPSGPVRTATYTILHRFG